MLFFQRLVKATIHYSLYVRSAFFRAIRPLIASLRSFGFNLMRGCVDVVTYIWWKPAVENDMFFISFILYCVHYSLAILVFFHVECWHLYIFIFFLFEVVTLVGRAWMPRLWLLRAAFTPFLIAALSADDGSSILATMPLIEFLCKIGFDNGSVSLFFNSLVDLHIITAYYIWKWLAVFAPYYCAGLTLAAPLFSAATALCAGYLIGGVYAAYFSTALIFISLVGASYILFVFPAVQSRYLELSSVYMSDYTNFGAGLVAPTNVERFTTGLTAGPQPSAALDASIGNLATDYLFINAEKMHSLRLVLDFADFLRLPFLSAGVEFVVDSLSIIMVFTVTCISFFVHLYSTVYMREDPHATRFFGLLSFFTFFMIVLVEASNLVMLYVGWEGVGLSSFLLIAFWYTRVPALKAAVKAVLINKIGDMFLIFAIAVITAFSAGRTTISELPITFAAEASAIEVYAGLSALDLAALALVLAAFVKSAQIFFHTWLPDAMEGPTPVSALLHAATMVTAGVYLVIRFSTIIEFSPAAKLLVLVGGLSTVVFSSVAALTQCDIKKIIAYSTCSQLGLMFFACGLSAYDLALFHFFNHAFFKCLLFLLAGIIIHELQNEQDIRRMGALAARMPATFVCFLAASFSLAGFPFFAGAASKDLILLAANHLAISSSNWGVKMFLFSTNFIIFLTAAYTARLVYFVFLAPVKAGLCSPDRTLLTEPLYKEPAYAATAALLAALSAVGGRVFDHLFVLTEGRFISVHEEIVAADYNNLTPLFAGALKWVPFLLTLSALLLAHVVWLVLIGSGEGALRVFKSRYPRLFQIYKFFSKKCYFDEMYNLFLIRPILRISYVFNRAVEDGIFKFTAFGLWRLAAYPKRWRLSTTRYTLVNHLLFSSVGTVFLIIGSFNFY